MATYPHLVQAIEQMVAIFYALYGLSLVAWPRQWLEAWRHIFEGPHPAIRIGLLPLIPAALLLATHNLWEPSPRVVVTLIGWLALAKAALFLLAPELGERQLRWWLARGELMLRIGGVIALVIAGVAAWAGFFMPLANGGGG